MGRAVFTGRLSLGSTTLSPIDPVILSQARTTFSLLVLFPILIVVGGWRRIALPARDIGLCCVLGILGVAASNYFYYLAIERTNVAIAITVQYTAPIWVLMYVVFRGQQELTAKKVAAVALALAGIALVVNLFSWRSSSAPHLDAYGIAGALLASLSFAFYNVAGHGILARHDRWRVLLWTLASAAAFWLVVSPPWKVAAAHYSPAQWWFLFIFSMLSVLGAFSLYFLGLQYLEPSRAIIASCLEPVFSILLAATLLGETLRSLQSMGIVLVLAAIVVAQRPETGVPQVLGFDPIE